MYALMSEANQRGKFNVTIFLYLTTRKTKAKRGRGGRVYWNYTEREVGTTRKKMRKYSGRKGSGTITEELIGWLGTNGAT